MATARGITETKIYDRQAVIDRYGIPPELIPDFYGLKGDTSDNIPGVPGIGDKTASELIQRFGSLEEVLAHIDEISGAKRKQNLHRARRGRARLQAAWRRCSATSRSTSTSPPRRRASPTARALREVFREYELRDPLRRLEEALGDAELAAPAPAAEVTLTRARARRHARGHRARSARAESELCVVVRATEAPEGALFAEGAPWRFAVGAPTARCSSATATGPRRSSPRVRRARRWSRTTPRRSGSCRPGLVHDTLLGAYLLEPARRGYPFAELCEERGLGQRPRGPASRPTRCCSARSPTGSASRSPSAAWRR